MDLNLTKISFKNNLKSSKQSDEKPSVVNNSMPTANNPISKDHAKALKAYALSSLSFKGSEQSAEIKYIPEGMTDIDKIAKILLEIEVDDRKRFEKQDNAFGSIILNLEIEPEKIQYLNKLLNAKSGEFEEFEGYQIADILSSLNKDNAKYLDTLLKERLDGDQISGLLFHLNKDNGQYLNKLLNARNGKLPTSVIGQILSSLNQDNCKYLDHLLTAKEEKIECFDIADILSKLNKDNGSILQLKNSKNEFIGTKEIKLCFNLSDSYKTLQSKTDINEISLKEKSNLLKILVKNNCDLFDYDFGNALPILPKNKNQYCSLMKKLVESLSINIKPLTDDDKKSCFGAMNNLCSNNKASEIELNKIRHAFPELEIDTNNIKILQEVIKDSRYKSLKDTDKHILQLAALFHNIDKDSVKDSAFAAYTIVGKLGIPNADEVKLHSVINCQDWRKADNEDVIKDIAYELRRSNSFELVKILSDSKLKAKKINPSSDKETTDLIEKNIKEIQSTAIPLPQTKIPKASQLKIGQGVKEVETDGIKNKVIYMNQNPDLESAGFEKGTKSDNFWALLHSFDKETDWGVEGKIAQFDSLKSIETDSLLSTSFIRSDYNHYRAYMNQGFVLDVDKDDIGAAYYKDFGSGRQKDLETLKRQYLFGWGSGRKDQRTFISDGLKYFLGYNDKQYIDLMNRIQDCHSIMDIEKTDKKAADVIQKLYKKMECEKGTHNEILVTRPKVQGVFAYNEDVSKIPEKLRKYAQENDLPIIVFEDTKR